tara:strand:- start:2014 stop:2586 length:573 start_codon:yes stop_codon:yes gene_type:complete
LAVKNKTMGVLNKLKNRISGPAQNDMSSPVYGFDTGRARESGVNAVNVGLAAGASAAPVVSSVGKQVADLGSTIGKAIGIAYGNKETKSKRLEDKSEAVAKRGRKAVDEGRDRKGNRLLTRAATLEDRSIDAEEKEYFKKHGKRKPIEVSSLESRDIAGSFTGFLKKDKTKEKKFGDRFANAPIINENLM